MGDKGESLITNGGKIMKNCMDVSLEVGQVRALLNAVLMTEDPWDRDSLLVLMGDVLSQLENNVSELEEVMSA